MNLKSLLNELQKELKSREKVKEEVQKIMRKATQLSKRAIVLIHQKRMDESRKLLEEAKSLFKNLREICGKYPDMFYTGIVNAAFQEYAEANILMKLIEDGRFVSPNEIDVPAVDYILGLADVIGELRRQALDALRSGNLTYAEKCLQIMENIYLELMAMDEGFLLVPGLRRKCDVARRIIETTRGELTVEARRSSLEKAIRKLEERFEKLEK
ncbi:haloacid dehalogenase [Candidatus Bathyarchaeota archaeon]|nr:MAG: haloacid dehalogenase [Candidatus Bathyarchaeota archaeon]